MWRRLAAAALAALSGACTVIGVRAGTEEPPYQVLSRHGEVEIRRYAPRLAAETWVVDAASEEAARSVGFRRLAGFIFGANRPQAGIAMTAPVEQAASPAGPRKIAMTAPVEQASAPGEGGWRVRFFMPAAWTAETLPVPDDPAVAIVEVPGETVAVLRFSGTPSAASVAEQASSLLATLVDGPWRPDGAVIAWFYDPPWTLPPLRRNEVAVPVAAR